MRVNIDISLIIDGQRSFGRIFGSIEIQSMPRAGDTISFTYSRGVIDKRIWLIFSGHLSVTNILHIARKIDSAENKNTVTTLFLEDIVVDSDESASLVAKYLFNEFGLDIDGNLQ